MPRGHLPPWGGKSYTVSPSLRVRAPSAGKRPPGWQAHHPAAWGIRGQRWGQLGKQPICLETSPSGDWKVGAVQSPGRGSWSGTSWQPRHSTKSTLGPDTGLQCPQPHRFQEVSSPTVTSTHSSEVRGGISSSGPRKHPRLGDPAQPPCRKQWAMRKPRSARATQGRMSRLPAPAAGAHAALGLLSQGGAFGLVGLVYVRNAGEQLDRRPMGAPVFSLCFHSHLLPAAQPCPQWLPGHLCSSAHTSSLPRWPS